MMRFTCNLQLCKFHQTLQSSINITNYTYSTCKVLYNLAYIYNASTGNILHHKMVFTESYTGAALRLCCQHSIMKNALLHALPGGQTATM